MILSVVTFFWYIIITWNWVDMCELFELFWLQASASDSTAASSTEISTAYCSLAEMYLTDEWWALNYHLLFTFTFDLNSW